MIHTMKNELTSHTAIRQRDSDQLLPPPLKQRVTILLAPVPISFAVRDLDANVAQSISQTLVLAFGHLETLF